MRIDLFLKQSRLIKRRTIAHEAITNNLVLINNVTAKPATKVKVDDIIQLNLGLKQVIVKVKSLIVIKDELMYELIDEKYLGQKE